MNISVDNAANYHSEPDWPSPVGLSLGILSVVIGQIIVIIYHYFHCFHLKHTLIQPGKTDENFDKNMFWRGAVIHLCQPEGFLMLGGYLVGTWMFNLLPSSYYSFRGGVSVIKVFLQLFVQDSVQTGMHLMEHNLMKISPVLYLKTHKPHHRFTSPCIFDAFNGSMGDTFFMILIPLFVTAHTIHANVWEYMVFGTMYSCYLVLIHSEYSHPWDDCFSKLGIATASDHHVHHKLFNYNYGHLFTYWDRVLGTYRSPTLVKGFFTSVRK